MKHNMFQGETFEDLRFRSDLKNVLALYQLVRFLIKLGQNSGE